jgi:hypothetical protein
MKSREELKALLERAKARHFGTDEQLNAEHLLSATGWINTRSGKQFYPLAPDVEKFSIHDQAASLSQQCRYLGHPDRYYSVGMHALAMSYVFNMRGDRRLARAALVHDNGEAYYGDIVRPLKRLKQFAFIESLELQYADMLDGWLGLEGGLGDEALKAFDTEIVRYEAPYIFHRLHPAWKFPEQRASDAEVSRLRRYIAALCGWTTEQIQQQYLDVFETLFPERAHLTR